MILIDQALKKREEQGRPIRVGMVGAGFMGRAIAHQIMMYVQGMRLVAISNRNSEKARHVYMQVGREDAHFVSTLKDLDDAIRQNKVSFTDDPFLLCRSEQIDAIIEVTGSLDFAAQVTFEAIKNKKHVILMNAEVDGTVGPVLNKYAEKQGVILANADGDQPGVMMNLYRFMKGIGVKPFLLGNIKGLLDHYRNPTTQEGFSHKWGQKTHMVTSFADGTKISFEQAVIANATGMTIAKRGMIGPSVIPGTFIQEAVRAFPTDLLLRESGIVDYIVGPEPAPGVFILGTHDDPFQRHYLSLYKMGEGPFYCFYHPYHLCHFEVHNSVARAVLFNDSACSPIGPYVDVVATAKIDLKKGQILDGVGFYMTYGQCEKAEVTFTNRLLPMGLVEGSRLKKDVAKDQVLTYDDVEILEGSFIYKLRIEQDLFYQNELRLTPKPSELISNRNEPDSFESIMGMMS